MGQIDTQQVAQLAQLIDEGRLWEARKQLHRADALLEDPALVAQAVRLGAAGALNPVDWALAACENVTTGEVAERAGRHREFLRALEAVAALGAPDAARWFHDDVFDALMEPVPDAVDTDDLRARAHSALRAADFTGARDLFEAFVHAQPTSDAGMQARLQLALCHRLVGDLQKARECAVELRQVGRDEERAPQVLRAARQAEDLLANMDLAEQAAAPQPVFVAGYRALEPDAELSLAEIRRQARARGWSVARVRLDIERLAELLATGHSVLLEEERAVGSRVVVMLGVDAPAGVVLVDDGARCALRTWAEQARRSELFGNTALVVLTDRTSSETAIAHEPDFDLLDACLYDDDGVRRAPAHAAYLATQVMQVLPELGCAHAIYADSLLERMQTEGVWDGLRDDFLRWYQQARRLFGDSEWPRQAYARYLELDQRHLEAGIAWNEAYWRDLEDPRNALGVARALLYIGQERAAQEALGEALFYGGRDFEAYELRTDLALGRGALQRAQLWARVGVEVGVEVGASADAWLTLANVHEACGALEESTQALDAAIELDPNMPFARARRWRRARYEGDWARMQAECDFITTSWPAWRLAWLTAVENALAYRGGQRALEVALEGARRCDFDELLVEIMIRIAAHVLDDAALAALLDDLQTMLSAHLSTLVEVTAELVNQQRMDEAVSLLSRLHEAHPEDLSVCWRLGRTLFAQIQALGATGHSPADAARAGALRAEAERTLDQTLAARPQYSPAIVLRAELLLDDDPAAALALLDQADPSITTALLWEARARALRANGRRDEADELCARLRQLDADEIAEQLEPVFALNYPRGVLRVLQAYMDERDPAPQQRILTARALWMLGDAAGALAAVESVEDVPDESFAQAAIVTGQFNQLDTWSARRLAVVGISTRTEHDPWLYAAYRAVAQLAAGDSTLRDELRERVGEHPWVRARLALGAAFIPNLSDNEDAKWLKTHAPGHHLWLERIIQRYGARP